MMFTTPSGSSAWRSTSQKRSAVSGVVSAGLRTTVLPQASAGATFHASMRSGKFQGMIWPARPPVREGVLELVRPTRVVEEVGRRERQVDVARLLDRLAAVERLEDGELARPLLEDARDAEQVLCALGAGEGRPAVGVRGAGRRDGAADVRGRGLADGRERLLVARGDRLVGLRGLEPLPADEVAVAVGDLDDVARLRGARIRPVAGDG